ncbi:MAG TPA: NADH-quinone oxidoreductase subunit NuoN [Burkholderiales bacterium]|nr:NADH-quinone oxidoreductase subunit NuoN [Burkholderiales bacterium]
MSLAELLSHLRALPEMILLLGACVLMLVDLASKSPTRRTSYLFAQGVLAACFLATAYVIRESEWQRATIFYGMYVSDMLGHILKLFSYLAVSAALVYARPYLLDRGLLRGEFLSLLLFSLLGIMVMVSANSFLTLYVGLELLSLCLYTLVALNRDSTASTEAAMKYFVLGALASGLLLYGMSMIYGATGSLQFNEVAARSAALAGDLASARTLLVFGLVFVIAGIAFKLGVVPFHMWIPDVYEGASTAVTLVLGTAPKIAAFAMALRLLVNGLPALAPDWQQMLIVLAVLSMALGNLAAIAQTNLKRMLAYSTISHMGFMLLGLLSGVVGGNARNAVEAYGASMFYTAIYVLMSLGAFGVLLLASHKGVECERLEDLKGMNRRDPWVAMLMLLMMFSLAGVPPMAGFYAKLAVISSVVQAGQIWLAVVAVVFSLIGAFYYLRVVKLMYFDEPGTQGEPAGGGAARALLTVNGLALLALGLVPQQLMQLCQIAIQSLF